MNSIFDKKYLGLAVSCALAFAVLPSVANADTGATNNGYVTDQRGNVVKSGFGLCWRSGFWSPAMATAECDGALAKPVAMAQAKTADEPVAARTAAPKPAAGKVTLDADTLFDFDKAVLRPAGIAALDDFVAKMKDIDPEVILAVGHADRFGSDNYNQRLSEKRASAVKTYLLSKGVAENRIKTEGRGKTQPLTKAGECLGAKSAKVIACLQQDRRVDIEVVGTKLAK